MATYEVTTPDGAKYEVAVPEGATEQDAINQVRQRHERKWSDVPGEAMRNAPESALNFGKSIGQAITHPIDTAKAVGGLAAGVAAHATEGIQTPTFDRMRNPKFATPQADTGTADAMGAFLKDRYGSIEGLKNTLATDPLGAAADAATVLTPVGGALARGPGLIGQVGRVAQAAGKAVDPLSAAGYAVKGAVGAAKPVATGVLGGMTGVGMEPFREAGRVGADGTAAERGAFTGGMRGTGDPMAALQSARGAVQRMRDERGAAYKSEMGRISGDTAKLEFAPVQQAWFGLLDDTTVKAGLSKADADTTGVMDKMQKALAEWEATPAAHTVEGLDGLKQRIRDLYPTGGTESAQRAVTKMANAVKGVIEQQAPEYAAAMNRYANESDLINEVERTLSLGDAASADAAMRKLQSVMRNNVNTNYGNRLDLVNQLENYGADTLRPSVAGQSFNSALPRGLAQVGAGAGATYLAAAHPGAWPAVALTSPRLMGEATYGAANVVGKSKRLADLLDAGPRLRSAELAAFQSGRMADALNGQKR